MTAVGTAPPPEDEEVLAPEPPAPPIAVPLIEPPEDIAEFDALPELIDVVDMVEFMLLIGAPDAPVAPVWPATPIPVPFAALPYGMKAPEAAIEDELDVVDAGT